jgi:hypothetical protein
MRARYPHELTASLARDLGRGLTAVYLRSKTLGLYKSQEFMASPEACRLRRGDHVGAAFRFTKGQTPFNKGLRRPGWAPGRMSETQFKKGLPPATWMPIGSTRLIDGYLYRKISDVRGVPHTVNWKLEHHRLWTAAHGPIPPGYAVAFKDGNRQHVVLDNLELIARRQLMARNTVHNLPAPLPQTIQLLGALNRQIRRRSQQYDERHHRSTDAPLRNPGRPEGQGQADGTRSREDDRGRGPRDHRPREGGGRVCGSDGGGVEQRIPVGTEDWSAGAAGSGTAVAVAQPIDPADVLVLLEDGPKTGAKLMAWLGLSSRALRDAMAAMERAGQVTCVSKAWSMPTCRWALGSQTEQVPAPPPASLPPPIPEEDVLDDLGADDEDESGDEDDLDDVDEDLELAPLPRGRRGGRLSSKFRKPSDARRVVIPADGAPAWWCSAPRAGFTAHVDQHHQDRMNKDPLAQRMKTPPLLGSRLP